MLTLRWLPPPSVTSRGERLLVRLQRHRPRRLDEARAGRDSRGLDWAAMTRWSELLEQARDRSGVSQRALAARLDSSEKTVYNYLQLRVGSRQAQSRASGSMPASFPTFVPLCATSIAR